jgi:hypothetical protein
MAIASINYFPETGYAPIDGLISGAYWQLDADRVITWSTSDNEFYYWYNSSIPVLQAAFDAWEAVIDVDFVYTGHYSDFPSNTSDIEITLFEENSNYLALGVFPNSQFANDTLISIVGDVDLSIYPNPEGDIFFNIASDVYDQLNLGSKAFQIALHEIGHAIGLKHPHDGGVAGYTTYDEAGISELNDGLYTIMSYDQTSSIWPYGWAATPMPLDILAAQAIYGANPTTNSGDDTYYLYDSGLLQTIYDVSGNDTIDASFSPNAVTVDLNQGNISSVSTLSTTLIALGTTIENAAGTQWNDHLIGNNDHNLLHGWAGNDVIEGGDGIDTSIYQGSINNFSIYIGSQLISINDLTFYEGNDTLYGIERIRFSDSNIAFDIDGNAGQAYRIYKAAFDRIPDHGGLGFWIDALDNGAAMTDVAYGFTHSNEFISLYGDDTSDEAYVDLLYANVLDRDADQGGYDFWIGHMDADRLTREQVLIEFSESAENQTNVIDLIANGIQYTEWS